MSPPIQFKNHPFRFLLYLEWILLTFAAFTVTTHYHHHSLQFYELTILNLLIFGLIGLRLPTSNIKIKIVYTAIEIILILLTDYYGLLKGPPFPFLYLIVVIRSCFMFNSFGRLIVTSLSYLLFLITILITTKSRLHQARHLSIEQEQNHIVFFCISIALLLGIALVFVLLLMNAVLSERKSREQLAIAHEKLQQYAFRVENQATLEERNRIAREIHDSLGHSLTALNLQLETALKLWNADQFKALSFLTKAKELGSKALQDVRHSVSAMRSNPLQGQSLEQAIMGLAENVNRATGVSPICQIALYHPIPIEMSSPIFRIVQESFTNICKYAKPTEVRLKLTSTPTTIHLIIEDDGVGFDLSQNTTGFGHQSMRDRTLALGGTFNIYSSPGYGCKITIVIPLLRVQ
ncbi:sensor histidine kinase [Aetokthonos hydrillicola Thurmond2011]|jgi:signal transduction histidine kinase|uniref:histidine kinase n=1 Tax=Aetokthonos hydrillicola Thurmond2011 TaxID=2712845 RepID=A0AAP5MAJ7_9CYAN|nr:sensor histidine kinase [Aetokthonos hydrillicola]MBO3461674.1 sensor histidine kinase [Aetokthonos hydrillicola CCALA 1050]MBW4588713.1 sensor histidine kinase [Aetokthonos hydrillicola CCALA 1050]MDR9895953.1 sensor histidine kinase [Aetokthonos hydrillicola Thurmond2011]